MKSNIIIRIVLCSIFSLVIFSCAKDDANDPSGGIVETEKADHVTARFDGNDQQVFIAPATSLTQGTLSFKGNGYHLDPVRSARIFTDALGWIYVFDYGGGYLKKLAFNKGRYAQAEEINIMASMGNNAYVRPWKISEKNILIHHINTSDVQDQGNGITKKADMYVTSVLIPEFQINEIMDTWTVPLSEWDVDEAAYVSRIDAPTVLNDKIYYGVQRTAITDGDELTGMHTIVLDFPSLQNPSYIRSQIGNGHTNGYRGENMHAIDGFVYQCNRVASADNSTVIVRLKDGQYDESWSFNVTEALGEAITTPQWYYAGNGIAYMPVEYYSLNTQSNSWGIVRLNLNNQTVTKMNVPLSDMWAYQKGIVRDGEFYMAVSPVGETPYVYIFDVDSDSPDAFRKGLEFDTGNVFIEGLF